MISKKRGVHIEADKKVVADGGPVESSINFVSHAHSDHAVKKDAEIVCSEKTEKLLEGRYGIEVESMEAESVKLIPSGHITGSSAALIDKDILYTGDVSLQDRLYIEGFQPVKAKQLIIEATYGIPSYRLPNQQNVVERVKDWIEDTNSNLLLFGYSLGKAQKIQKIVQEVTDKQILAHQSIVEMNKVVESVTDLDLRAKSYTQNKKDLEDGSILIAPSRSSRADWVQKIVDRYGGQKAGFSGWAVNDSFRYRGGYDKTFALSDHCGFDDLVKLVESVDPEKVYTHHGFDDAFASYLRKEKGYNARALKNNQSSLERFSKTEKC